jgi:pantetheine-phosphate adenylyltransferase
MRIAVYPGSFDPLTNGHLDVLQRAARLFDKVVIAVAKNDAKHPLFTMEERRRLVAEVVADMPNVEADQFDGLLVDYVSNQGATVIVRGLRAISDFEFEFQLALMNRKLNEQVETVFLMPKDTYSFLSSRMVKEIARLGGDEFAVLLSHADQEQALKKADQLAEALSASPTIWNGCRKVLIANCAGEATAVFTLTAAPSSGASKASRMSPLSAR